VIKLVFLAKKQSHLSYDQFITYLVTIHAPLVKRMPGARRYVINAVMPDASLTTQAYDAIEEIWFDSMAAMQEAMASREGWAVVDDRRRFSSRDTGSVVAEEIEVISASRGAKRSPARHKAVSTTAATEQSRAPESHPPRCP
jgi:uncharacterized protein (TIGR02118 family)